MKFFKVGLTFIIGQNSVKWTEVSWCTVCCMNNQFDNYYRCHQNHKSIQRVLEQHIKSFISLRKKRNKSFEIFLSVWWNFSKLAWRSLSVKILSNERKYHDVLCVVWTTNLTIITAVIKIINLSNASWSSTSKVLSLSKLAHYGAKYILNAHLNFETQNIWEKKF